MNLYWAGTENASHLHVSLIPGRSSRVGVIDYLSDKWYHAIDMSSRKWVWRKFDNLEDAKAWLLVCVRMNHALAR